MRASRKRSILGPAKKLHCRIGNVSQVSQSPAPLWQRAEIQEVLRAVIFLLLGCSSTGGKDASIKKSDFWNGGNCWHGRNKMRNAGRQERENGSCDVTHAPAAPRMDRGLHSAPTHHNHRLASGPIFGVRLRIVTVFPLCISIEKTCQPTIPLFGKALQLHNISAKRYSSQVSLPYRRLSNRSKNSGSAKGPDSQAQVLVLPPIGRLRDAPAMTK